MTALALGTRVSEIATALCQHCDFTRYRAHAGDAHEAAAAHRDETGHRVLAVVTETTSYEATP